MKRVKAGVNPAHLFKRHVSKRIVLKNVKICGDVDLSFEPHRRELL